VKGLRWEYKISLISLIICLVLISLLAAETYYAQQTHEDIKQQIKDSGQSSFEVDPLKTVHFLENPLDFYDDIIERPLFLEGRKPIEIIEEDNTQKKPTKAQGKFLLVLTGLLSTPKGDIALFKNPRAKTPEERYIRLKKGESYDGWELSELNKDKVVMKGNKGNEEILLRKPKFKKPSRLRSRPTRKKPVRKSTTAKPKK